jgi:hypothetical protein
MGHLVEHLFYVARHRLDAEVGVNGSAPCFSHPVRRGGIAQELAKSGGQ